MVNRNNYAVQIDLYVEQVSHHFILKGSLANFRDKIHERNMIFVTIYLQITIKGRKIQINQYSRK